MGRKTPPSPLMSPPSRTKTPTKETLTTKTTTPKQQQKKTNDDEYKQQLKQKHDIATTRRNRHRSARDAALAIKLIQDEEMQDVIDNIEKKKENEKDVVDDDVAANGCDRQDDYDEIMNNDKSIEKMKQLNNTKIIVSNHIIKIPNSNYNITKITPKKETTTIPKTPIKRTK